MSKISLSTSFDLFLGIAFIKLTVYTSKFTKVEQRNRGMAKPILGYLYPGGIYLIVL